MKLKLATVNLEVADPQRSKRLYVDALGMTENAQRSHPPDFVYLESEGADLTLGLPANGAAAQPSTSVELGFETDDVPALQARLRALGFTGFTPQRMGWGEVIEGRDPDGHRIVAYALAPP